MAERFQRLFSLTPNLYSVGCPIIIEAGALQKDTESGTVLAQIKMRNIGEKTVASCKVSLKTYENNGDEVEGVSNFSYLDLNADSGDEFGTKVPIILPNKTTRSFTVDIDEVVFSDGTVKRIEGKQWNTIPGQKRLADALQSSELAEQYKLEVGEAAEYLPEIKDGLFLCTCGAANLDSSQKCYRCGNDYAKLNKLLDVTYFSTQNSERRDKEEAERVRRESNKKKYIKIAAAIALIAVIYFGISFGITSVHASRYKSQVQGWKYSGFDWAMEFNSDGTYNTYSSGGSKLDSGKYSIKHNKKGYYFRVNDLFSINGPVDFYIKTETSEGLPVTLDGYKDGEWFTTLNRTK